MVRKNQANPSRRKVLKKSGIALSTISASSVAVGAQDTTKKKDEESCPCPQVVAESNEVKLVKFSTDEETILYRVFKEEQRIEYQTLPANVAMTSSVKDSALTTQSLGEYEDLVQRYETESMNIGGCNSILYKDHSAYGVHIATNKALGRISGSALGGLLCLLVPFDLGVLTVGCSVVGGEVLNWLDITQAHEFSYWFWDYDSYGPKTYRGAIGEYDANYSEIPDGQKVHTPTVHISPLLN